MRLGVATKDDLLTYGRELADAGFDYLELSVMAIASLSVSDFDLLRKQIADCPLKPEIYQSMLPGDCKLVGEAANPRRIREYMCGALDRIERLGGGLMVLGSAGARMRPDDWPGDRAEAQLAESIDLLAGLLSERGMKLGIEQIAPFETNMINSLEDAQRLIRRCGQENLGIVVDLAHMRLAGIAPEAIRDLEVPILHAHIAKPEGRLTPVPGDGCDALYRSYLSELRRKDYDRTLSVETGNTRGIPAERISESGAYLKRLVG